MGRIVRQCVGIDVSQKTLDVTFAKMTESMVIITVYQCSFKNNQQGFEKLISCTKERFDHCLPTRYTMEATGVYHEKLAYQLHRNGCNVSIVLPNKISSFMRTLTIKTITDKTCSAAIAQFGLERKLDDWNPPKETYKKMRQLTRERDQLVEERSSIKNRLHAELREEDPLNETIERLEARIKFLSKQEAQIKKQIEGILKTNPDINDEIAFMTSIPGIGRLTAIILLAETNGFELIRNKKQLVSYAGFDVREKQSGTSIRGTSRISKKGNKHLRKAMYLPSLTAVRMNENLKLIYARIVQRHGIKKKALIAIQRRLLELCYVLFKNRTYYSLEY